MIFNFEGKEGTNKTNEFEGKKEETEGRNQTCCTRRKKENKLEHLAATEAGGVAGVVVGGSSRRHRNGGEKMRWQQTMWEGKKGVGQFRENRTNTCFFYFSDLV